MSLRDTSGESFKVFEVAEDLNNRANLVGPMDSSAHQELLNAVTEEAFEDGYIGTSYAVAASGLLIPVYTEDDEPTAVVTFPASCSFNGIFARFKIINFGGKAAEEVVVMSALEYNRPSDFVGDAAAEIEETFPEGVDWAIVTLGCIQSIKELT